MGIIVGRKIGAGMSRAGFREPSFFEKFGAPLGAFSLFDADKGGGSYAEIQRTHDDATQNFTMAQLDAKADEAWVNSDLYSYSSEFAIGLPDNAVLGPNNTSLSSPEVVGGQNDAMKVTLINGSAVHDFRIKAIEANQYYSISFEVFIPSTNSTIDSIRFTDITGNGNIYGAPDSWVSVNLTDQLVGNNILRFFGSDGGSTTANADGDWFAIRNLSVNQTTSSGVVKQWYNSSGGVAATQSNTANMWLAVEQGVAVMENGRRAFKSDGAQYAIFSQQTLNGPFCIMVVHNGTGFITGGSFTGGNDYIRLTGYQRLEIDSISYQNNDNRDNLQTLSTFNRDDSDTLRIFHNSTEGVNSPFPGAVGPWSTNGIGAYAQGTITFTGTIQVFFMYDEDKNADLANMQAEIIDELNIPV